MTTPHDVSTQNRMVESVASKERILLGITGIVRVYTGRIVDFLEEPRRIYFNSSP